MCCFPFVYLFPLYVLFSLYMCCFPFVCYIFPLYVLFSLCMFYFPFICVVFHLYMFSLFVCDFPLYAIFPWCTLLSFCMCLFSLNVCYFPFVCDVFPLYVIFPFLCVLYVDLPNKITKPYILSQTNRAHHVDAKSLSEYGVYMPRGNPQSCFVMERSASTRKNSSTRATQIVSG